MLASILLKLGHFKRTLEIAWTLFYVFIFKNLLNFKENLLGIFNI